jgi:hypothetical protein
MVRWMLPLLAAAIAPVAIAAQPDLDLPTLISVDASSGAAVLRSSDGHLVIHRRGQQILQGRWQLQSVASDSVIVVPASSDDREAGTRVRLHLETAQAPPIVIRTKAPDEPLAPRLVLQTGRIERTTPDEPDKQRDQP